MAGSTIRRSQDAFLSRFKSTRGLGAPGDSTFRRGPESLLPQFNEARGLSALTFRRGLGSFLSEFNKARGLDPITFQRFYKPISFSQPYAPLNRTKLGKPSKAFIDRFGKRSQSETGWQGTLTNAPTPQSTSSPSQKFSKEVFQTRETRKASETQPFQILRQHQSTPNLNPNLAQMFKEKNTQLGAVRRTRRFL